MKKMTMTSKIRLSLRRARTAVLCLLGCATLLPGLLPAADSDERRWYMSIRRGEFNQSWGVEDAWGLGLGLNFNRYWGVELALDTWEHKLSYEALGGGTLGELATSSFIPQLRFRYPLFKDKFVPYVVGGFGGSWYQFNDRKSAGFGRNIDADGSGWAASVGGGFDWFIADNIALNLEAKQIWHSEQDMTVDGQTFAYDPSDFMATIGFRIFFQENDPKPLVGATDDNPTRFYLGFRIGGSLPTDDEWSDGVSLDPEAVAWGDFNHHYGACLGVDFGRYWGLELAADGGEYTVQADGLGALCEYGITPIIPQLRVKMPLGSGRWVPYAMGGFGFCYGEAQDYKQSSAGNTFEGNGFYPAFTLGAGIEYFIARNISFGAETRWLYTWGHEYELNGQQGSGDFSNLQVLLALRLYLIEL